MKRPKEILADLDRRDLLATVRELAERHHVTLDDICASSRVQPACSVRHLVWARLVDFFGSNGGISAVARIWGVDHTTVLSAVRHVDETTPEIVFVRLATFETPSVKVELIYERRNQEHQIGVKLNGDEATWFGRNYPLAREVWSKVCEENGATSFRMHSLAGGAS